MAHLSRRNFFRVLPAAPVAVVAAGGRSFDEQLADAIAKVDAQQVMSPATDKSATETIRRMLDFRYLGRADRRYIDREREARLAAMYAAHDRDMAERSARAPAKGAGSADQSHLEATPECFSSPDTAVTCPALEGAA